VNALIGVGFVILLMVGVVAHVLADILKVLEEIRDQNKKGTK
jgi:hypothetical protein